MKVHFLQDNFKKNLAMVSHAVAGKGTLPILSHVRLATTTMGRLELAGTDLAIAIAAPLGVQIDEPGAVTIPAKLLSDVVNGLPNDRITLTLDPRAMSVQLTCGRYTNNLKGMEATEFPTIPLITDQDPLLEIDHDLFRKAVAQVAFASANTDARPVLAGVLFRFIDDTLILQATDGFRLSRRSIPLHRPRSRQDLIVPRQTMLELVRLLGDKQVEGDVRIYTAPTDNHVQFSTDLFDLSSRVIDGKFPDADRVIPAQHTTRLLLERDVLTKAVQAAAIFAQHTQNIVRLDVVPGPSGYPGSLAVSANAAEVGDNRGELDATIDGPAVSIALNARYLEDAIDAVNTPTLALELQTPRSAAVVRPVGTDERPADDHVQVLMPMTLK